MQNVLALPTLERTLVERIYHERDQLVALAAELIAFDTTTRATPDEPCRDERSLQELLADRLARVGAEVELFEPDPKSCADQRQIPNGLHFDGRPQLLARFPGVGGAPGSSLLLNGHIDVVSVGEEEHWTSDPWVAEMRDGRLYGRGACDMKGGVAAMVFAVEQLAALDVRLRGDVLVNTVTDEESSGAGSIACAVRGVRADACIVPEPTDLEVWLGCRGTCLATVTLAGRAAHVEIPQEHWSDGGGVNAIDKAQIVLTAVQGLNHEWTCRARHQHPYLSTGRISPVRIRGGDWVVTTPESCVLEFDVTFLPEQADESGWDSLVVREVEEWITRFAATDPWLAEHPPRFSWSMSTPPLEIEPTEPVVASLTHALERMARPVKLSGLDSWYDGATFARIHGTPAVGFGPGSIKVAHAVDEFVPIDELVGSATGIALALVHHCGVASSNGDSPSPEGSP